MSDSIAHLRHPKAGRPTVQYVYRDAVGTPVLMANRYDKQDGKFFLPYDLIADAWKAPELRPLYRLDALAEANADRAVIVTEGEKCADALASLGYVSTTTFGGANGAHKTDLAPLRGRKVILWPDKDEPGLKYAEGLAATLHAELGALPRIIPTADIVLRSIRSANRNAAPDAVFPKGWDAADAVASGWGVHEINTLIEMARPHAEEDTDRTEPDEAPLFDDLELWHTPDHRPFATFRRDGRWQSLELTSSSFKQLLAYETYRTTGKAPPAAKLDDMQRQMIGQARFEGATRPVFTRIGRNGDAIVLDLGGADCARATITANGWRVDSGNEPRFVRSPSASALPMPLPESGDVALLKRFVNAASEDDFRLMVAWLLGCLRPEGPYPLLILSGEQGSAKSTTSKVLRSLVDPSTLSTRSLPQDEHNLVIAARGTHVLAFDNISRIKGSMADALCRLATGGGFATRKLHSDSDEVLFDATRPSLLNGIPDLAERADLADRAITLTLPSIAENRRAFEGEFWDQFEEVRPRILAGLLDATSGALERHDSVTLQDRPRLADFARWVTAAEPSLGWPPGAFLAAYQANRRESEEAAVESNAVASAILTMVADSGTWSGTAAELIAYLRKRYPALTDAADAFPRQAAAFGSELRRVTPLLRRQGIAVAHVREGKDRRRMIQVTRA
ncbi:hypothetical protein SAMN04488020_12010 [Palleronia marisminoris]|uniref:Toprim domain-containing protein n=1 Tax=Palleronia marisminoris TaxID=315423 RepID=A0A1Y5TT90_9RHOB|nr:hypothetical protein [Palleronia marisminoris]SFH52531.1 hypothetical protein SAMN04488020_12010 [Palleronia marisminoris]SLN71588.1 hypothetical protein PAM7066_03670 [Palleronia marisminoris]